MTTTMMTIKSLKGLQNRGGCGYDEDDAIDDGYGYHSSAYNHSKTSLMQLILDSDNEQQHKKSDDGQEITGHLI